MYRSVFPRSRAMAGRIAKLRWAARTHVSPADHGFAPGRVRHVRCKKRLPDGARLVRAAQLRLHLLSGVIVPRARTGRDMIWRQLSYVQRQMSDIAEIALASSSAAELWPELLARLERVVGFEAGYVATTTGT